MTKKLFFFPWHCVHKHSVHMNRHFIAHLTPLIVRCQSPSSFWEYFYISEENTASYLQKSSWLQSPIVSQQLYKWLQCCSVRKSQAIRFHSELCLMTVTPSSPCSLRADNPGVTAPAIALSCCYSKLFPSILRSDARKTPQSQAVVEGKVLGSFEIPLCINFLGKQAAVRQEVRGLLCNACTTAGFDAW